MTKKEITFNALDSYFLNTYNNTLNTDYLRIKVYEMYDIQDRHTASRINKNVSVLVEKQTNKRNKITSLIWSAFIEMTNEFIKDIYIGTQYENYICTSEQLKSYLKQYGYNYSVFDCVCDELNRWRNDLLNGEN